MTDPDHFYVRVCFTTFSKVICRIEQGGPGIHLADEMKRQMSKDNDWND